MSDQIKFRKMLEILMLLSGNFGYTINEIAEKFDTTPRTIYRYIETFKDVGFKVSKSDGYFRIDKKDSKFRDLSELIHFTKEEATVFRDLIKSTLIERNIRLDLSKIDFIENRNCNLILGLFKTDEGILSSDHETFYCALTLENYKDMLILIEPFCNKDTKSHQYLYDIDNPIDFLFSPAGTW